MMPTRGKRSEEVLFLILALTFGRKCSACDSLLKAHFICRCGGIGRRVRFKIEFLWSAGSIPAAGIFLELSHLEASVYCMFSCHLVSDKFVSILLLTRLIVYFDYV